MEQLSLRFDQGEARMTIAVEKLMPTWGAEVRFDLSQPIDGETARQLVDLFDRYHLLLFRNQTFTSEQQVAFSKLFGPISHRSPAMKTRDTAFVSNVAEGGVLGDGELLFHSDNTFFQHPLKAIGLFAMEVPSTGGDTTCGPGSACGCVGKCGCGCCPGGWYGGCTRNCCCPSAGGCGCARNGCGCC